MTYFTAVTPVGRLSSPSLGKPCCDLLYPDGRYKLTLDIDRSSDITDLIRAVARATFSEWGGVDMATIKGPILANGSDSWRLRLKSKLQPPVTFEGRPMPVSDLVAGDIIRVAVSALPYTNAAGQRGIAFGLDAIEWVAHAPPEAERPAVAHRLATIEELEAAFNSIMVTGTVI